MEGKYIIGLWFHLIMYDFPVKKYIDIRRKNKAWKEEAEVTGASGECM